MKDVRLYRMVYEGSVSKALTATNDLNQIIFWHEPIEKPHRKYISTSSTISFFSTVEALEPGTEARIQQIEESIVTVLDDPKLTVADVKLIPQETYDVFIESWNQYVKQVREARGNCEAIFAGVNTTPPRELLTQTAELLEQQALELRAIPPKPALEDLLLSQT